MDRKTPLITAKDVLWFLYLYVCRPAAAWVPPVIAYGVGRCLEPVWRLLLREDQRRLRERLVQAFGDGVSAAGLEEISRRYFTHSVVRPIDELYLERFVTSNRYPPEIEGLEHLKAALAAGNGAMLVNFHCFANRAAKRWLAHIGYPILSVRVPRPYHYAMGRFGQKFVRRRYGELISALVRDEVYVDDREFTLKILQHLRSGGLVNLYLDAQPSDGTHSCPFFGLNRVFPVGFLKLARLSGCAIIPMLCAGEARKLRVRFDEPFVLEGRDDPEEFLSANLRRLACIMESQVREYPDQWELWTRRWK